MHLFVDILNIFSDPVFSTPSSAYIMRKKLVHTERINLEIMWSHALGLYSDYVKETIKQNNGIWAPDSGPCEPVGQTEVCSLPSGSEFYSWGKRNKVREKPNC